MVNRGRLIAFEGIDGAGKTYQMARLEEYLQGRGFDVLRTREPGATAVGESIRELLLNGATQGLDPLCELLLFAADRRQHVIEVLKPALAAGRIVLTDRYLYSSVAYQGFGRGVATAAVDSINELACDGLLPDLTLVLDVEREAALERMAAGRDSEPDRMEREAELFYSRVRAGFCRIAREHPQTVQLIDGGRDRETVTADVVRAVAELGL